MGTVVHEMETTNVAREAMLGAGLPSTIPAYTLSMAGLSAGVPMGASHGIGYVLGAVFDVPHGHTSCVMLPSVLRWNLPVNAAQQQRVSEAFGRAQETAADLVAGLVRALGLPGRLSEVGVGRDRFREVAGVLRRVERLVGAFRLLEERDEDAGLARKDDLLDAALA